MWAECDPPKKTCWATDYKINGLKQVILCLGFLICRMGETVRPFLQSAGGPRGETPSPRYY